MTTERWQPTATLLRDGRVLVVGGYNGGSLTTAEVGEGFEKYQIPIVLGPVDRTNALGQRSVSHYVRDPDGNLVEIMSLG